jgi:opacity protein-like surface antigen
MPLLHAQVGGRSTYQFLNNVPSARVAGQGGNAIANTEEDLNFGLWNPSLLSEQMHGQLSFSMVDHINDIVFGDINYAHHVEEVGTFYAGMRFFNYGEFERADALGIRSGTFTAGDYAFTAGYGRMLDSNWRVGANLKFIYSDYDQYSSSGIATDLSATYLIPKSRIAMALVLKNLGFQLYSYNGNRENIPFEIQFSFSNRFKYLPLRWQITLEQLETLDLSYKNPTLQQPNNFTGEPLNNEISVWNKALRHVVVGVEFAPTKSFNIQFGYNFRKRQELNLATRRTSAGFSVGLGLKISKFRINYARNWYHISGSANHFTITTDLQDFKKKKTLNENQ